MAGPDPSMANVPANADAGAAPALRLRFEVAVWRQGWVWPACALLAVLALLLEWLQVQPQIKQLAQLQAAAIPAPARPTAAPGVQASPGPSPQDGALQNLAELLGRPAASDAVAQVLALAQRQGIALAQAQYLSSDDQLAGTRRLQISLPAHTSYPQARALVTSLLQALPQASIDQIELKRSSSAEAELALSLKLSLWRLLPVAAPATSASSALRP